MKKKEMNGPPAGRWLRLENFRFVYRTAQCFAIQANRNRDRNIVKTKRKASGFALFIPTLKRRDLTRSLVSGLSLLPCHSGPSDAYPTQGQGTHSLQHGKSGASGRVFAVLWCTCSECSSTRRRFDWADELWCVRRGEPRRNSGKAEKRGKSGQTNPTTEQASSSPRCAALHPAKQSDRLERCFSPHKPQKPEKPFCRVAGTLSCLLTVKKSTYTVTM